VDIYGTDYDTHDGTCVRDYIHVEDLANVHIGALRKMDEIGSQKLNLGNGEGYSVKEVIEAAREITGHPIPAREAARRAGDPGTLVATSERTHTLIGVKFNYPDIKQIVQAAWDWHSKNPNGYKD
jgi:UDP-glucose 4-epimerase